MSLLDDLKALLSVQEVDSRIDRARAHIAALDTGATTAARFNEVKAEAEALRAAATKAQADQKDAEMQLQSIEEKAKQVNKTLYGGTVQAARELEHLQQELAMLGRQKGDAEEKTLLMMEAATEAVTAAEAAEKQMRVLASRYKKIRAEYKEKHAEFMAEIAEHEKERAEVVKPVPPALLTRYDAIRVKKNGVGAAVLSASGNCGACHTHVNSGLAEATLAGQSLQTCEYCGRILIPESATR